MDYNLDVKLEFKFIMHSVMTKMIDNLIKAYHAEWVLGREAPYK